MRRDRKSCGTLALKEQASRCCLLWLSLVSGAVEQQTQQLLQQQ